MTIAESACRNLTDTSMTPAVYILCGIPFSGKSTLARILASRRGWTHVDVDAIAQRLMDPGAADVTEDQWTEAFAASHAQVADSLARGRSVVHDATNWARSARDRVREIARQHGAAAYVIYVAVPVEDADRRRRANQGERHSVADSDFRDVVSSLEPPTADESVLVFDGTLDLAAWLECYVR